MEAKIFGHEHADPALWLVVAIAGWIQRDQQAAIVYLLEENRVLQSRLRGRKLRSNLGGPWLRLNSRAKKKSWEA